MASKQQIGDRIRASFQERYFDDTRTLYQAWCPQIEVNGKLMCIGDKTTPTKCREMPSEDQAVEYAKKYRDKLRGETA
jgi:hypothetical protein